MKKGNKKRIYLDYAAATPIDKKVASIMKKNEVEAWSNVSSLHLEGERAKKILEEARTKIAAILRCRSSEIYFTSGGTEAANIAVLGVLKNKKNAHLVCSSIEHPAVLQAIKNSGAEVSIVTPDKNGIVNPEAIKKEIKENTVLVCLMHSNNEIGTIQPTREVKSPKMTMGPYLYLLVDASQSALYEDVAPERLGADLLILDGIKMYGPRGIGVLFIKHGVEISPTIFGGGQEKGLRSGTENVVAAAGLALALQIAAEKREKESSRLTALRDYTIAKILKEIPGTSLNGDPKKRLPNNINICFASQGASLVDTKEAPWEKIDSEFLVIKLDTLGFAVSAASACNNLNLENSSYVIEALGKKECASASLRITLGRATTKYDLNKLIAALKKIFLKS